MKHIPLPAGPFKSWPFFQPDEIEQTATDDLRAHGLLPTQPAPVNIDKLVRSLFGFDPIYEDTGEGVLGFIRFGLTRPEKIILHVSLGSLDSETTEHRRRSTLAHECGHGRLHVAQFTELMQAKHSGRATERVRDPKHRSHFMCRTSDVRDNEGRRPPPAADAGSWHRMAEWQANRYMAAVLAPKHLVELAVRDALGSSDDENAAGLSLDATRCAALAPGISRRFCVSRQLAECRLGELFATEAAAARPRRLAAAGG